MFKATTVTDELYNWDGWKPVDAIETTSKESRNPSYPVVSASGGRDIFPARMRSTAASGAANRRTPRRWTGITTQAASGR